MPNRQTAEHAPPRRGDGPRRGRPLLRQPLVRVGPVPERARLGHRPRGLLGERRRLGLLPARPRPLARVPLERGRHGRDLGHPPRPLPRARALERERPDPEGAHVRPHRARRGTTARTSRSTGGTSRGCRATRCCSWRYHYPQGAFPYDALVHHGRGPATTRSWSCSTPASSTTTATGRSTSPTRRPRRPRC